MLGQRGLRATSMSREENSTNEGPGSPTPSHVDVDPNYEGLTSEGDARGGARRCFGCSHLRRGSRDPRWLRGGFPLGSPVMLVARSDLRS